MSLHIDSLDCLYPEEPQIYAPVPDVSIRLWRYGEVRHSVSNPHSYPIFGLPRLTQQLWNHYQHLSFWRTSSPLHGLYAGFGDEQFVLSTAFPPLAHALSFLLC